MHPDHPGYFEPTPEWDKDRVNDRLWSYTGFQMYEDC
jgi:hypothetical protein